MQKEEYWKKFLTSGTVADYLSYCKSEEKMTDSEDACDDAGTEDKREHNAGFY